MMDEDDVIYVLACQCENHLDQLQEKLLTTPSQDGIIELCAEFQQRFAIWAAHLGVFARKSQCLDTRLRNHPDLQDLVVRLLDLLRGSLEQCRIDISSIKSDNASDLSAEPPQAAVLIHLAALRTVDDLLGRLSRLGVTIRQSSRDKIGVRAKRTISGHKSSELLEAFATLGTNAVQVLYPKTSQSLRDHLVSSMIARYEKILHLASRHEQLGARREPHKGLASIPETSNDETGASSPNISGPTPIETAITETVPSNSKVFPESAPTSIDIEKILSRGRPPDAASTRLHNASSVQVGQGKYPPRPKWDVNHSILPCEWCYEPLELKTLSDRQWHQHINRDMEPYICIAKYCPDSHPAFATFLLWSDHMQQHNPRWYQQVYLQPSWICPFCVSSQDVYSTPHVLYMHLRNSHSSNFADVALQVISRQSRMERPRAWNYCLLCQFRVEEQGHVGFMRHKRRNESPQTDRMKSARLSMDMMSPDHYDGRSDSEGSTHSSNGESSREDPQTQTEERSRVMEHHIAGHLRALMLLTLTFADILKKGEVSENEDTDTGSRSVDTDDRDSFSDNYDLGRLSDIVSEEDPNKSTLIVTAGSEDDIHLSSDHTIEHEIPVPDADIDLQYIPRRCDYPEVGDDTTLQALMQSQAQQSSIPTLRDIPEIRKRLIICCDDTLQGSVSGIRNVPSNVTRLSRSFSRMGRDAYGTVWQQIVHYETAKGTHELSNEIDRQGGFGIGTRNIIEAYTFIVLNYEPGDQIFCFGFSRGAYTARAVASLINDIGVISPEDLKDFPYLYKLYQEYSDNHRFRQSDAYRQWVYGKLHDESEQLKCAQFGDRCHNDAPESSREVQVVGVFDTVGSLRVPDLAQTPFQSTSLSDRTDVPSAGLHNLTLSPYIRHAFQALALDEHRASFAPTLWYFPRDGDLATKKPKKPLSEIRQDWERVRSDHKSSLQQLSALWTELVDCQMYDGLKGTDSELLQVWFPGFHINVGGGADDPLDDRKGDFEQLAMITFAWMCEQIAPYVQLCNTGDRNLLDLANNLVQDRYALIHSPRRTAPQTLGEGLLKKASEFISRVSPGPKPVSPEIQYGWADGPIIDSYTGSLRHAAHKTRTPGRYSQGGPDGTNEMIHPTVQYRMQRRQDYRPEALEGFTRQKIDSGFQWEQGDIVIPEYRIRRSDVFSRYIVDQDSLKGESQASEFVRKLDEACNI